LLTKILAKRAGIGCGDLSISFGDAHIYSNHIEQVDEQMTRTVRQFPTLKISDEVLKLADLSELTVDMLELKGYYPYPALKGEVAV
jgi:thymidylate synthase